VNTPYVPNDHRTLLCCLEMHFITILRQLLPYGKYNIVSQQGNTLTRLDCRQFYTPAVQVLRMPIGSNILSSK